MAIRVCIAGATGWTGAEISRGVIASEDMIITGAAARSTAKQDLGDALGLEQPIGVRISATIEEALQAGADVLIDYTSTKVVKDHVRYAIKQGVNVVIGTSGLTAADYDEIEQWAEKYNVGIVGGGNFSVTAAMMQHLALIAAEHIPQFEVLECASARKEDVPSGTARELAEKLGDVRKPHQARPVDSLIGPKDARGTEINGVQVHAVRLPSFLLRVDAMFGMEGERLIISHEAGQSAEPYVAGTLMAARKAATVKGLVRGLDELLFKSPE